MKTTRGDFLKVAGAATGSLAFPQGGWAAVQVDTHLPRSSPEAQGISSQAILDYVTGVEAVAEMHSFMLVRHGNVVAEGWWRPYRADAIQHVYSLSKPFTSTAVGMAIAEGRFRLDDPVVKFFPDKVPSHISSKMAALTVQDLLMMSCGQGPEWDELLYGTETDWVKTFFTIPVIDQPGTTFSYNNACPFMLAAIIQRLTGQRLTDYLKPRLFDPLGVYGVRWAVAPDGINTAAWGISATTETFAKLGQLYVQKGKWQGRQLLPASWVEDASSFHIQQPSDPPEDLAKLKPDNDWLQGYGYLLWRQRHNTFRGDGAFGQFLVMMPDQDAVLVVTSEISGSYQPVLDLAWKYLLPAMQPMALPPDATASKLHAKLNSLTVSPPKGKSGSSLAQQFTGKTFHLEPNSHNFKTATFHFDGTFCILTLKHSAGESSLRYGFTQWLDGTTDLPHLLPELLPVATQYAARDHKYAGAAAWTFEDTLELRLQFYETPHHQIIDCTFNQNAVAMDMYSSISAEGLVHISGITS